MILALSFDWTITLGMIVQSASTIVGLLWAAAMVIGSVKNELKLVKTVLETHAESLDKHDVMLSRYDTRLFDLVGGLQRLIGRFEAWEHRQH